ncbi:MAG: N-acetylmuramoyl-L-alanine amidase [Gammaproteobacteria bacterium]|nr:N-acetylmuramoyl-L-alanine amidase [Gammaproteobacteria bacterium]MDH5653965.1 N-acetylmuramoyl-L-alanine amidase [Gammaproteobacteria bacterium]
MKKCALVIGHKRASPGASNKASGLTEFAFNDGLAFDIEKNVNGVEVQRIYRRTYETLPGDINEFEPDFIVSLHCNAYNASASGTEVLFYHRSAKGKQMAEILQTKLQAALGLKSRGIKPKTAEDRGGHLLKLTKAPCVIAEPFFIDNDSDLQIATTKRAGLIEAYARGIEEIAAIL